MRHADWLIYGGGLSALVLAERLGNAGKTVLLFNPGKSWGGIFGGLNINGQMFDAGMTNFEFDLFGEPADDIQNYDPDQKRDVGRYVHFVQRYLSRFASVFPLPTPRMLHDGHLTDDMIISNRFTVLGLLAPENRALIRDELTKIIGRPNPLHPSTKNQPDSLLATKPFDQVSIANHGPTFHRLFIEPMFSKVLGMPTSGIEGVFHRNGWVPLFYPESLLSQFGDEPHQFKSTVFSYPEDDHFGAFISRIAETVHAMPNVTVVDSARDFQLDVSCSLFRMGDNQFSFSRLAWGGELDQLLPATSTHSIQLPAARRASLDLFFLNVRQDGLEKPSVVLIDPEPASPFYRITNQTMCRGIEAKEHKIIFECNSCNWNEESPKKGMSMDSALNRYGINPSAVVSCERRTFKGALSIPNHALMADFNHRRQRVAIEFPEVALIGASSGYVSVTLNDHIIQALKIAHHEGAMN
jgi:hypothetical protein